MAHRVLMVGLDLNPPWVEGIRNTAYELAKGLSSKGYELHMLTKGYCYHRKIEDRGNGIVFHRILTSKSSGYLSGFEEFFWKLPTRILEIAKDCKIDVIHAHSSYPVFGSFVGRIATLTRSRSVFSLYSSSALQPTFEYPYALKLALRLAKSYWLLKLVSFDAIVVNSRKALHELLFAGFSKEKTHYVPNGIDTKRFTPNSDNTDLLRNRLGISEQAKIILFAGDLTPCKGVEKFLSLLNGLKLARRDFVGIILTKGLYEKEDARRQLVNKLVNQFDLTANVRLLGIRSDVEAIYNLSDVVVFPFRENYTLMDIPRALLEAMACGRPVVATRIGAISEVLRQWENGVLVPPNDEPALMWSVNYLLENEEKAREIGKNAVNHVLCNYESSMMTEEIERVYDRL